MNTAPTPDADRNGPPPYDVDRLYVLLPEAIRGRDEESGGALRALLRVIAEQVNWVDRDIAQLYDNWFIETCQPWVVPYLGELIGYRTAGAGPSGSGADVVRFPRQEVAHLLHARRRKGTAALLLQVARDSAGWPARVVEFGQLLAATTDLNAPHAHRGRTLDVRRLPRRADVGGPFDRGSHLFDARRPDSRHTPGRYGPESVGVFVWRLKALPIFRSTAHRPERKSVNKGYTFSVLGNDMPLFTRPTPSPGPLSPVSELDVPVPISRRAFSAPVDRPGRHPRQANDDYYGEGKSVAVYTRPADDEDAAWRLVPAEKIVPTDLTAWRHAPPSGFVAVDPVVGRLMFAAHDPVPDVRVSYAYGFTSAMGGGGYERSLAPRGDRTLYVVAADGGDTVDGKPVYRDLEAALAAMLADFPETQDADATTSDVLIEIRDSTEYTLERDTVIGLTRPGQRLELRAAAGQRPILRLLNYDVGKLDPLPIDGRPGGRVVLDGLLISENALHVKGPLAELAIRHCTLVPGWSVTDQCRASHGDKPSLTVEGPVGCVRIDRSILGSIDVFSPPGDGPWVDPVRITLRDSILDATTLTDVALAEGADGAAHATLCVLRSTVFGRIVAREAALLENSIFTGSVTLDRRQIGCVRFCYLPLVDAAGAASRTPRRYECRPAADAPGEAASGPLFVDRRYGTPGYARLADDCPAAIAAGADDESEMGAFHDEFEPIRVAALKARLKELTPAAVNAGVFFADPFPVGHESAIKNLFQ